MAVRGKLNIEPELATIGIYDEKQDWKERAGSGPWGHEPFDFMVWVDNATGYTCAMKRNHGGSWCGYVYPGNDHPIHTSSPDPDGDYAHGLESGNPVWLDVHGGVTWHREMDVPHDLASGKAVGFDCAHHMDMVPGYSIERNHPDPMGLMRDGEYRTASFVLAEVRSLARQISEFRPLQQLAV